MSVSETGGLPPCWHPPIVYDGVSQSELVWLWPSRSANSHSAGKDALEEIRITDSGIERERGGGDRRVEGEKDGWRRRNSCKKVGLKDRGGGGGQGEKGDSAEMPRSPSVPGWWGIRLLVHSSSNHLFIGFIKRELQGCFGAHRSLTGLFLMKAPSVSQLSAVYKL